MIQVWEEGYIFFIRVVFGKNCSSFEIYHAVALLIDSFTFSFQRFWKVLDLIIQEARIWRKSFEATIFTRRITDKKKVFEIHTLTLTLIPQPKLLRTRNICSPNLKFNSSIRELAAHSISRASFYCRRCHLTHLFFPSTNVTMNGLNGLRMAPPLNASSVTKPDDALRKTDF